MTHVGPSPVTSAGTRPETATGFIEWGAVFAGAVLAAALSFVLLTFGSAIGLSATSPWPNSGLSATFLAGLAVFWIMVQQIGAFMAGGYVAGRMRPRWQGTAADEVQFRDGLHGGLVWAVGIVIGAALVMAAGGAAVRTGVEAAGKAAAVTVPKADPMQVLLDTMLRPASMAQPGQKTTPQAGAADPTGEEARSEMSRIIATSLANGSISTQDRAYLAQIVAQRTGVPQPDAEKRVNEAFNSARDAADKARRAAVLTGFVTAASLIISFGAAWWAALKGGQHRDNAVPPRFDFTQRMRPAGGSRSGT